MDFFGIPEVYFWIKRAPTPVTDREHVEPVVSNRVPHMVPRHRETNQQQAEAAQFSSSFKLMHIFNCVTIVTPQEDRRQPDKNETRKW